MSLNERTACIATTVNVLFLYLPFRIDMDVNAPHSFKVLNIHLSYDQDRYILLLLWVHFDGEIPDLDIHLLFVLLYWGVVVMY